MNDFDKIIGSINPPTQIAKYSSGSSGIQNFLSVLVRAFFAIAVVVFLFMILFAGFQWLTSGGDKESIAKARGRLVNAIIGLAIISLAFFITKVVTTILAIQI